MVKVSTGSSKHATYFVRIIKGKNTGESIKTHLCALCAIKSKARLNLITQSAKHGIKFAIGNANTRLIKHHQNDASTAFDYKFKPSLSDHVGTLESLW